jgi:hypothetical protein
MSLSLQRSVVLALLLAIASGFALAQAPPIKVGELNVLSGSFAANGKTGKQGALLPLRGSRGAIGAFSISADWQTGHCTSPPCCCSS